MIKVNSTSQLGFKKICSINLKRNKIRIARSLSNRLKLITVSDASKLTNKAMVKLHFFRKALPGGGH